MSLKTDSGRITVQTNRLFPRHKLSFLAERNQQHKLPKQNGSLLSGNLEGEKGGAT